MSRRRTPSWPEGVRSTREALVGGSDRGRLRIATPAVPVRIPTQTGAIATPPAETETAWVWLRRDIVQSMASGGAAIVWDTEVLFPARHGTRMYSALPTDTLTVPFDAMVAVEFAFGWDTFNGATDAQLEVDGTAVDLDGSYIRPAASGDTWQQETMILPLAKGTRLRVLVNQTSGQAQDLLRATMRVTAVKRFTSTALSLVQPEVWLQADELSLSDTDPVSSWDNDGTLGGAFTQDTAASQPTFRTGQLNGLPGVVFDGSDDFLTFGSALYDATDSVHTMLAVVKFDDTAGIYPIWSVLNNSGQGSDDLGWQWQHNPNGGTAQDTQGIEYRHQSGAADGGANEVASVDDITDPLVANVIHAQRRSGDMRVGADNTWIDTDSYPAYDPADDGDTWLGRTRTSGATHYLPGTLFELLSWGSVLTDAELADWVSSMTSKWGL